jgi:hypothetical protein
MIVAATGHRPDKLGGYNQTAFNALADFALRRISLLRPSGAIVGMAQGWDTAVAVACTRLCLPWVAAIPFEGQESRWDERAQNDYQKLLLCASQVYVVNDREVVEEVGVPWALQKRNEWMVDNSAGVLALWNGDRSGGTFNCVEYAKLGRRQIINVWPEWEAYWEGGMYLV